MGVYIPDIKLPKDEPGAFQVIVMYVGADRKLRAECEGTHEVTIVPEHGDLIDRKALLADTTAMLHSMMVFGGARVYTSDAIKNAPTIIPAEEGAV